MGKVEKIEIEEVSHNTLEEKPFYHRVIKKLTRCSRFKSKCSTTHFSFDKMAAAKQAIKFSPALKELRLHLCQKSAASAGVREFVEKHYVPIKLANPQFPILVRECSGITPKLWARFGYGREESVDLSNKSAADILTEVGKFKG